MTETVHSSHAGFLKILGVRVYSTTYEATTFTIKTWAYAAESRYVCIANVHMLMEAYDSVSYQKIINQADYVTPDGMPLVWLLRVKGIKDQTRVYGPILMDHILEMAAREQIPVGFYGAEQFTLDLLVQRLSRRFPQLHVAYKFSPPFHALDKQESERIVEEIAASEARILFVGLGCPKQERWMSEHRNKIDCVMIGVGAAFDFHSGLKPQAPAWIQNIGMEWLFRLLSEPARLWRRYLYHNPRFILLAILDLLGLLR